MEASPQENSSREENPEWMKKTLRRPESRRRARRVAFWKPREFKKDAGFRATEVK